MTARGQYRLERPDYEDAELQRRSTTQIYHTKLQSLTEEMGTPKLKEDINGFAWKFILC